MYPIYGGLTSRIREVLPISSLAVHSTSRLFKRIAFAQREEDCRGTQKEKFEGEEIAAVCFFCKEKALFVAFWHWNLLELESVGTPYQKIARYT